MKQTILIALACLATACTADAPTSSSESPLFYNGYNCSTFLTVTICTLRLPNGGNIYFSNEAACDATLPDDPPTPIGGGGPALECECLASEEQPGKWIHQCVGREDQPGEGSGSDAH